MHDASYLDTSVRRAVRLDQAQHVLADDGLEVVSVFDLLRKVGRLAPARVRRRVSRLPVVETLYDREIVTRNYERVFGRVPDLKNPTTFNEKCTYKILHDRRPILTRIADKLRARDYVAERAGAQYLTELYQVCRSSDEIDWRKLPRRFVLKTNHGHDMNVLVPDKSKIDESQVSSRLDEWLATNFYDYTREWCYRDIRPALFAEEMLIEPDGATMALDWKFYTFDGRAELLAVNVDQSIQRKVNFYDRSLTRLPLSRGRPNSPTDPRFPDNIALMFSLADELGRGLDFVRVDMYNLGGRIVFGEFAHYPDVGLARFDPPEFDEHYGSKWRWPPDYGQASQR